MNVKKFVFLGPTLSLAEAQTLCPEAIFLPPARCGDFLEVLKLAPTHILLIDGFFEAVPAVWQKEILFVMTKGVRVSGASSMGALRAAELAPFGMEGIGEIYNWYAEGVTQDDAEVAMLHLGPDHHYLGLTQPLVNLRKTLGAEDPRFKAAQSIGYRERVWKDKNVLNQKAEDARLALQKFAVDHAASSQPLTDLPLPLYFKGLHQQVFCRGSTLPLASLPDCDKKAASVRLLGTCYVELKRLARLLHAHFFLTGQPVPDVFPDASLTPRLDLFAQHRWPELTDIAWLAQILGWKDKMQAVLSAYFTTQAFLPSLPELEKVLSQWQIDQGLHTAEAVLARLEAENCSVEAFETAMVSHTLFDYLIDRGNLLIGQDVADLPIMDFFALAFQLTEGKAVLDALSPHDIEKRLSFIKAHAAELKLLNAFDFYHSEDLSQWLQAMEAHNYIAN